MITKLPADRAVAEKPERSDPFAALQLTSQLKTGNLVLNTQSTFNVANTNTSTSLFVDSDPSQLEFENPFNSPDAEDTDFDGGEVEDHVETDLTDTEVTFIDTVDDLIEWLEFEQELEQVLTESQIVLHESYLETGDEIVGIPTIPYTRKSGNRRKTGARFRAYWIKRKRTRSPHIPWRALIRTRKRRKAPRAGKPKPR